MIKPSSTDRLLTLGMALTTDKVAMERRVRSVFAKNRTGRGMRVVTLAVCLMLLAGCFTYACVPAAKSAAPANTAVTPTPVQAANAAASTSGFTFTRETQAEWDAHELAYRRSFPAPRVLNTLANERGSWEMDTSAPASAQSAAIAAFLPVANALFGVSYTEDDASAVRYIDQSGYRSNLWRIETSDALLCGAVEAGTLAFMSADYAAEASDALHESLLDENGAPDPALESYHLDVSAQAAHIASVFGLEAVDTVNHGCSTRSNAEERRGWNTSSIFQVTLSDGRYALAHCFGDAALTLQAACVVPDADCAGEGVFWRSDLEWAEDVVALQAPADFQKGEPGAADLPVENAYAFYDLLCQTANNETTPEPNATFYRDDSGARENYWHIEGELATFNYSAKDGHIFGLSGGATRYGSRLGYSLNLFELPYEEMGSDAYLESTGRLFGALYGEENVAQVDVNAVYDDAYCTIMVEMRDGSTYEVGYENGRINWIDFFPAVEGGGYYPNWVADFIYVNLETGETFLQEW